jgi:hypothetical protein
MSATEHDLTLAQCLELALACLTTGEAELSEPLQRFATDLPWDASVGEALMWVEDTAALTEPQADALCAALAAHIGSDHESTAVRDARERRATWLAVGH